MKTLSVAAFGLAAAITVAAPAHAEFPEKPVTVIVPYSPGGSTDVLMRVTAKHLEPILGQPIVIKNISGAGGALGMLEATQAKPDGYTLGMYLTNTEVAMATGLAAFRSGDMKPVALLGDMYLAITAKGDGPYRSLADLKNAAKDKPGKVSVAMGQGMLAHFAAAMVENALKEDLKLVNVGGGAQKKAAVMGGHVDTMAEPTPAVLAQHKAGELKIIAVLAPERLPFLPDVPTAREQGFDVVSIQTNGLFAAAGTPDNRIQVIADAVKQLENDKAYQRRLKELNLVWNYKGPKEFAAYMKELHGTIQQTAEQMGVKK